MTVNGSQAPTTKPPACVGLERLDDGTIAVLTLEDPVRTNAMSVEMGDALRARVDALKPDETLRCVIVRAAGRDFSIGGTRQMLSGLAGSDSTAEERHDFMLGFYDRWLSVLELPVPVIVVIQGACIGVAPVWACLSDICVAETTARFQITFAHLGLYPGMALSYLVPRATGPQAGALALLEGRSFSGDEAVAMGLAARTARDGNGFAEALRIARGICANVPAVVRDLTHTLRLRREILAPVLEDDARHQARSYATPEFKARIANYLPEFYDRESAPGQASQSGQGPR
jgi:enoyl-CoA hydratase/carnithine racemase